MKPIYFTRHGQTVWNVENKICGSTDIELTSEGISQAQALGKTLANSDLKIDVILSSPLIRAHDTAKEIAHCAHIPLIVEPRLTEQCFGRFESTPRNGEEFKAAKTNFIDDFSGGETMLHLAHRIYSLLDELKNDDKIYLLVAHNGIARIIRSYFFNMTNEEFAAYGIKNCEILKFDL